MKISEAVVLLTHDINSISIECAKIINNSYRGTFIKLIER